MIRSRRIPVAAGTSALPAFFLAAAAFVLLAGCSGRSPAPGPRRAPHIVFITADALRDDHLSMNGYPRVTSRNIDSFAAGAWNFTDAVTVIPKTTPSFATMFTGWHPEVHGVRSNLETVPPQAPMLAEILRSHGYRTAGFVSNPVLDARWGFGRGFDEYRMFPLQSGMDDMRRAFEEWARLPWDRPTFVWVHFIDPHGPYTPPPEDSAVFSGDPLDQGKDTAPIRYEPIKGFDPNKILGAIPTYQVRGNENRVSFYVREYDAEIRYVDRIFGEIISLLRARGLFDSSLVIFASDHGESLGENNYYFEHGWYAYDTSLRIPLLIKEPGQSERRGVDEQVTTLDFFPTILAAAGIENQWPGPGRNLLAPLESGRSALVENSGRYPERYMGLRTSRLKYLRQVPSGREELYDLATDPRETQNRAPADAAGLRAARELYAKLLGELRETAREAEEGKPGAEHIEDLRRLGYVQ
jgi:arylsulfatase A-like enzyme